MMLIFYHKLSADSCIGSVNPRKISNMTMTAIESLDSCDIAEFKGQLLSADWWGPDPQQWIIDFDYGYKGFR